MKTCCGYSLEVPHHGTSDEYPQHIFSWRNKKKYLYFSIEKDAPYLELCYSIIKELSVYIFSLAGCPEAAVTNVYNAMKCATSEGALGVLVCNWSGKGHITHLPFCWPGFLMGAGLSWNSDCHWVIHATLIFLNFIYEFIIYSVSVLQFCTSRSLTKWHMQPVQTMIRLLLWEQSDQGLHCLPSH